MPNSTIIDIPQAEQVQMLSQLRGARYGYLLAMHVLLLCAAGRTPTEIAAFLFCTSDWIMRIDEQTAREVFAQMDQRIHQVEQTLIDAAHRYELVTNGRAL